MRAGLQNETRQRGGGWDTDVWNRERATQSVTAVSGSFCSLWLNVMFTEQVVTAAGADYVNVVQERDDTVLLCSKSWNQTVWKMVSGDGGGDRGQDEGGEQGCSLSETKTFRLSLEMQSFPWQRPLPLSLGALDNFSLSRAAFCSCNTTSQRLSQADLDGKERPYYTSRTRWVWGRRTPF